MFPALDLRRSAVGPDRCGWSDHAALCFRYVSGLNPAITVDVLRPLFEKFGALTRCEIKKRFAFVGYGPQHTLQADFIFEFAHAAPAAVRSIPAVQFCPFAAGSLRTRMRCVRGSR